MKALQKANAAGQKIYTITRGNLNTVLPQLHHNAETLAEIRQSVNAGKKVTTHTNAVSIPGGWSGFGYIVLDPVTGDGAYRINGGSNGGDLLVAGIALELIAVLGFWGALITPFSYPIILIFTMQISMLFIYTALLSGLENINRNDFRTQISIIVGIFLIPFTFINSALAAVIAIVDIIMGLVVTYF